jgi:hypothetical protein
MGLRIASFWRDHMPLERKYRELFNLTEVEDFLELRILRTGCLLKDLFLVVKVPDDNNYYEIDTIIETKCGPLKVFFCKDSDLKCNLLLHKSKFNYPTPGFLSSLRKLPLQKDKMEQELEEQKTLKKLEEEEFGIVN